MAHDNLQEGKGALRGQISQEAMALISLLTVVASRLPLCVQPWPTLSFQVSLGWPLLTCLNRIPRFSSSRSVPFGSEFMTVPRALLLLLPLLKCWPSFFLCKFSISLPQAPAEDILPPEGVPGLPCPHACVALRT